MRKLAMKLAALLLATAMLAGTAPWVFADTDLEIGGLAIVANTGGDSVLVRAGAGYDYLVLTTADPGDVMTVLDGPFEGEDGGLWYEISYGGTVGYVFAAFLVLPENAPLHPQRNGGGASSYRATGGGYLSSIGGTGGDGARLRDSADLDAAIVDVIPEGEDVSVIGDPISSDGYAWYPVSYAGETGWVAGIFLGGGGAAQITAQTTTPRGGPSFEAGAHVQVSGTGGDDLRLRNDYSLDGDIIGHAPAGAVVQVLDGPYWDGAGNGWYQVDYDGVSGFASGGYLVWTSAGLSARQVVASVPVAAPPAPVDVQPQAPAPKAAPPAPPSNAGRGQTIVNVAMRYLGYSYVWGGASPSGFDCSGFTMYVLDRAIGLGIGHDLGGQVAAGVPVNPKNLEPGDLVFFENTYEPGLSHVGIYIGGGQMVHAGSERTGVVISNIWDAYWGPKFYAARRY